MDIIRRLRTNGLDHCINKDASDLTTTGQSKSQKEARRYRITPETGDRVKKNIIKTIS
jgi:hypothetical protein